ncbi:carcinoembryonic antigen-related cell adhesion molecule 5 isoform X1 [Platichthys flesus]|uniref:carcinoembryonic antigen-related cell adhesion molecule 5 isoform X1 n=1 Tax=Platichthys flesus TaxID=8260 RepID=UPI002DB8C915|nr:carcinoembryonic antigen-related cell adhesion molecule 5 isoform X1 [Platichthys flesus]
MKVSHFSLRMFASLLVVTLGLCYCRQDSNQTFLGIPQLIGPSEAVLGRIAVFKCVVPNHPKNESVLLQLFNKDKDKWLGEYTSLSGEAGTFTLFIRLYHEGRLECLARAQSNPHIGPTVSRTHYLRVVEGVKEAHIVPSGPVEFFQGQSLELLCEITAGNNVSYKWLQNGQLISPSPSLHLSDNRLFISRTTSENTGYYTCMASNYFNHRVFSNSTSPDIEITVKDVVSAPDISFTVLKEDSYNYSAVVTCESASGTLPVTFSLYNRTELVANVTSDNRRAIFKLPLVLDQYSGEIQCNADNGAQAAHSQWLPLEVVSVGGPVTMYYDSDIGENFAVIGLRLYCKAAKGSHPRYQWFLNKTLLRDRGSFYYVVDQLPEQSILLLSVGRSSAGTYRCQVSDSFDNATAMSSRKRYLDKEVLNRLPVLVVAVVFGCFTTLILLVSVCCCVGVVYNRGLEMERMAVAYEDELDLCEYGEDAGVVRSARGGEFDQTSEASADEWPQIAEQKKTLEDETFEAL